MANPEHLAKLREDVKALNLWIAENPDDVIDLRTANLEGANLKGAKLSGAKLEGTYLLGANLDGANLSGANLRGANLDGANLSRAKLEGTYLLGANLERANLERANLYGANLDDANLYEAKLSGAKLSRAKLSGANLSGANLERANLERSDLSGANLEGANLEGANLEGANLEGANLERANLERANLERANLYEANLFGANLYGANLDDANLSCSTIVHTLFANVNLSETRGLETIEHFGPSTIGIDTLFKSQGNIPEVFLRGCGVPEQMIEYARALTANPIDFYSCFISHSTKDDAFARRLHADLQAKGVRCWFAPHDMRSGRKVHHQIDEAIKVYDKLLLILSEDSMRSNWVGTEIIKAKKKEDRRGTQMLFPIGIVPFHKVKEWEFFDSDSGRDLAREIREYHIPDFSIWKTDHDAYQEAFDRLLRDLKA